MTIRAELAGVAPEEYYSPLRRVKKRDARDFKSLSKFISDAILAGHKQDISMMLVGKKGRGKSYAGLTLGHHVAQRLAERIHHDPDHWEEFFNIDHVAIIQAEAALEIMRKAKKHDVLDYDDVAVGWNARDFQSQENKKRNDVFQINRIDETFQIFTLPDQFLIDKVPRSLVSHYAEMHRKDFSRGFTSLKFFEPITLHRLGKQIQPYLHVDRNKYVEYIVRMTAPKSLYAEYDKRRAEITKAEKDKRIDELLDEENGGTTRVERPRKEDPRAIRKKEKIRAFIGVLDRYLVEGVTYSQAMRSACEELGSEYSFRTARDWKQSGDLDQIRREMNE